MKKFTIYLVALAGFFLISTALSKAKANEGAKGKSVLITESAIVKLNSTNELETSIKLETWMLEPMSWSSVDMGLNLQENFEGEIVMEEWMHTPSDKSWGNNQPEKEKDISIEPWMGNLSDW